MLGDRVAGDLVGLTVVGSRVVGTKVDVGFIVGSRVVGAWLIVGPTVGESGRAGQNSSRAGSSCSFEQICNEKKISQSENIESESCLIHDIIRVLTNTDHPN